LRRGDGSKLQPMPQQRKKMAQQLTLTKASADFIQIDKRMSYTYPPVNVPAY
jgi:hypothetical protein